jgi:hypothetical protein
MTKYFLILVKKKHLRLMNIINSCQIVICLCNFVGAKTTNPILALILALQVKALLALPLMLLVAGLIGLKSLAVGLISAAFSGASLLRSVVGGGAPSRSGGASSRVAYEVKAAPQLDAAVVYPPSAYGLGPQRLQPDLRLISAAANN